MWGGLGYVFSAFIPRPMEKKGSIVSDIESQVSTNLEMVNFTLIVFAQATQKAT